MSEKFRETDKAISYLINGLSDAFPDATAEVILVVKNRPSRVSTEIKSIGPILMQMCKSFPHASVDFHPDNPYGFVAEVRCHGDDHAPQRNRRRDRPRVIVLLTRIAGKDVIVGSERGQQIERGVVAR